MSKEDDNIGIVIIVCCFLILFSVVTYIIGMKHSDRWIREEAVRNGAAEWVASEHGSPEFKWKVKNEQK